MLFTSYDLDIYCIYEINKYFAHLLVLEIIVALVVEPVTKELSHYQYILSVLIMNTSIAMENLLNSSSLSFSLISFPHLKLLIYISKSTFA